MPVTLNDTSIIFSDSSVQSTAFEPAFVSNTSTVFNQTASPTGWTRQTTHNNKALRVVSGSVGSGGVSSFTTVATNQTVGATTLTTDQITSHLHGGLGFVYGGSPGFGGSGVNYDFLQVLNANGASGSHNHTVDLSVQYVDVIVAKKD